MYLALVEGHMASATAECSLPIADDPSHDFKMMAGTAEVPGRAAHTMVVRLAVGTYQGRPVSKVELHPSSGRRHQLRVHCLSLGHPIVGDATYNDDGDSHIDGEYHLTSSKHIHASRTFPHRRGRRTRRTPMVRCERRSRSIVLKLESKNSFVPNLYTSPCVVSHPSQPPCGKCGDCDR